MCPVLREKPANGYRWPGYLPARLSSGSEAAQHYTAVAGALGGVGIVGHGLGAAVAHRPKLSRAHAVRREVEAHGVGSLLRELAVELGIAHVVGMALYFEPQRWLGTQGGGQLVERGA